MGEFFSVKLLATPFREKLARLGDSNKKSPERIAPKSRCNFFCRGINLKVIMLENVNYFPAGVLLVPVLFQLFPVALGDLGSQIVRNF